MASSSSSNCRFLKFVILTLWNVDGMQFQVGAKSCNIQFLRGKVPSWFKIPVSVALPSGVFETVLSEDLNKVGSQNQQCLSFEGTLEQWKSEISETQDRFTNLLQIIYLEQPNDQVIVRLMMGCVPHGGEGMLYREFKMKY